MFENKNDDVMPKLTSTMASFIARDWKENIDSDISTMFAILSSSNQHLNHSSSFTLYETINLRE